MPELALLVAAVLVAADVATGMVGFAEAAEALLITVAAGLFVRAAVLVGRILARRRLR